MEYLIGIGVVFFILYMIVRAAAKVVAGVTGSRHKSYRLIAARYRGKFESRGMVDPPTVSFPYNGSTVRVGLAPVVAGQASPPRTRVVARFGTGLPFRLELMPYGRPAPAQAPKGTRPVRTGFPDFDRSFIVQANDPEMACEFLRSDEARRTVEDLRKLAPPAGMLVSINPERLLVQVDRNLGAHAPLLDAAVRHALVLHKWLQTGVTERLREGIDIVATGPADVQDAGPPVCEVCCDPIKSEEVKVICVACKTPFHRNCWTFIGGCSTFGCSSKQCVSA